MKQWAETRHDDFDDEESIKGWSIPKVSTCHDGGNSFLGGHCMLSYKEVTKTYQLPSHEHLKISASVHMLDNWDGESVYMKLNDVIGKITFNFFL